MRSKVRTQVVRCPSRNRDVEVTYTVSGTLFDRKYELASCPAILDGSASCNRRCWPSLLRAPRYLHFAMNQL
jgi:hypothetical protein